MTSEVPVRKKRVARSATVARTVWLTPDMVRVFLVGDDLVALPELPFTDHYVKILFPPAGADYAWPFDPDALKESLPAEQWPVTRTYTIRSFDPVSGELAIDFVVHGDEGLAGPWAAHAKPGDPIGFFGPGGAWAPDPQADTHLLVGDEAAIPAIAAALEQLPPGSEARVFLEVASPAHRQELRDDDRIQVTWIYRDQGTENQGPENQGPENQGPENQGTENQAEDQAEDQARTPRPGYGEALAAAVRSAELPGGRLAAFVHGNAEMVKDLRRFLFLENGVDRKQVSISGYWRTGHNEDRWQATKREFNQQMELEEAG